MPECREDLSRRVPTVRSLRPRVGMDRLFQVPSARMIKLLHRNHRLFDKFAKIHEVVLHFPVRKVRTPPNHPIRHRSNPPISTGIDEVYNVT